MSSTEFDAAAWARQAFAKGYQLDGAPLPSHRDLTPNDMAAIFSRLGVTKDQVEATWKVLRDVAMLSDPEDEAPLSTAQSESLASLLAFDGLPPPIRDVLGVAAERVETQRDLHILAYIIVSAFERM